MRCLFIYKATAASAPIALSVAAFVSEAAHELAINLAMRCRLTARYTKVGCADVHGLRLSFATLSPCGARRCATTDGLCHNNAATDNSGLRAIDTCEAS